MSFKGQLFFDPTDIANIDNDYDSIASYLIGGDKAILDKENDTAFVSNDRGLSMLAVRKDSVTALAGSDGDWSFLQVDANGRLRVDAEVSVSTGSDKAEDSASADGDIGTYILAVRADSRPTNANTSADGDFASLFVNASGELWVKDADTLAELVTMDTTLNSILADTSSIDTSIGALDKAEDSVHASGDHGIMALAVRNDAGTALAADGDYIPFSIDSSGALRVVDSNAGATIPNTALENKVVAISTTAAQIDASPLSSRKKIMIQNDGNRPVFIGKSDVTADTTAATGGLRLNRGSVLELELGPAVGIFGVTANGSSNIRVIELA